MIERDRARALCEQALSHSTADACEVALCGGVDALTRFANNEIHQNMTSESYELTVRSVLGARTGRASTTRLDAESIARVVRESERITRLMPKREDLLALPGPQEYATIEGAHDPATSGLDADARAELASQMIVAAQARGLSAAGIVRCVEGDVGEYGERGTLALANSSGLFAYHDNTTLKLTVTAMGADSSGWADGESHRRADLDARALGEVAVQKAIASAAPRSLPPGEYTVILEPAAVADLVAFLASEFSATVVDEGRSFLSDRQGTQIFGDDIHLTDDVHHRLHRARPFDEEGVPVRTISLVEGGVHASLLYDRAAAQRHGVDATGHGLGVPSADGAWASALVLRGGSTALDEMIATTKRGVLVTRVWYTHPVDPSQLVITGMTRDGTFWIEDGEVRHGIQNMRFNQSLLELLRHVTALGPAVYSWPCVVPPLRAEGFRFSSETSF